MIYLHIILVFIICCVQQKKNRTTRSYRFDDFARVIKAVFLEFSFGFSRTTSACHQRRKALKKITSIRVRRTLDNTFEFMAVLYSDDKENFERKW